MKRSISSLRLQSGNQGDLGSLMSSGSGSLSMKRPKVQDGARKHDISWVICP